MREIVIVTDAEMGKMTGDVTLILRRAYGFYESKNLRTIILSFGKRNENLVSSHNEYCDIIKMNFSQIFKTIINQAPSFVILYCNCLCALQLVTNTSISKNRIDFYLDLQGALEETVEYGGSKLSLAKYFVKKRLITSLLGKCKGVFVVSEELKQNCEKMKPRGKTIEYHKIRCGINAVVNADTIFSDRLEIRKRLSIPGDAISFLYSGYRMKWQNIDKIIEEFKQYDILLDNTYFVFLCNTDESFEKQIKEAFPKGNYFIGYFQGDEYSRVIRACDIGYIIRDYNETNRVAFPNKFSDYLSSGLLVALNKALPEPYRVLKDNHLLFVDVERTFDDKIRVIYDYLADIDGYKKNALCVSKTELVYVEQIDKLGNL